MLNARWLETFVTLCDIGHFTRAAERLHMTQPGVSQQVAKLEGQVGQALLTRQGKSFTLTPAGEAVLAFGRARRVEEAALRRTLARDDPDAGEVTLACSGSFAMRLYPALLPLMALAPHLTLRLEATPQERVSAGVIDGRFDLGITDHAPTDPRLLGEHIGDEALCLVLPADAPTETPTFAALQERGLIAHPDGYAYAEEVLGLNFPGDYAGNERLRIRGYVNQIGQIPVPVAAGIGYTILPESGVETFAGKAGLRVVPLPRPVTHARWLITRHRRQLAARVQRIIALIKAIA